jgi:hypothetical protein
MDLTVDFAPSFAGGITAATFIEGDNLSTVDRTTDYTSVANWIRMFGKGITSTKQDGTMIQQDGLMQAPAIQSSISDQATLDLACQALVDLDKNALETIVVEVVDSYPPGTFSVEDQVDIESPTTGLSGYYTVKKITRDLTDPNYAKLDLSNRTESYDELQATYQRMVQNVTTGGT